MASRIVPARLKTAVMTEIFIGLALCAMYERTVKYKNKLADHGPTKWRIGASSQWQSEANQAYMYQLELSDKPHKFVYRATASLHEHHVVLSRRGPLKRRGGRGLKGLSQFNPLHSRNDACSRFCVLHGVS